MDSVAFAALIAAYQEADEGEAALRAMLPMAGRSLLEHQVRRAIAAGAGHAVILVERVPAALNAALDRLRKDGIMVKLARDPMDAADHFHPEENILLVADGLVAAPDCFEAMAARHSPTLLVVSDTPENENFERVDADHRWAGLALTNVETLAATAEMLGDWDLESTLMRRIVQSGADFLPVDGENGVVIDASEAVLLADHGDSSRKAGRTMLRRNSGVLVSWPERFLYGAIAARIAPILLDRNVEALWLRIAAVVLTMLGAGALWQGWLWSGLALILLAGPIDAIAGRIDLAQLRDYEGGWIIRFAKATSQALALVGLGRFAMVSSGEIAFFAMALTALALLLLTHREALQLRRLDAFPAKYGPWFADGTAAIWCLLPFALTGFWFYWPVGLIVYAVISLFFMQNIMKEALRQSA